jgi:hypothetical protein
MDKTPASKLGLVLKPVLEKPAEGAVFLLNLRLLFQNFSFGKAPKERV